MLIKKAQMTNNSNGLPMVEVMADICEGDFKGYFGELYRSRLLNDARHLYRALQHWTL